MGATTGKRHRETISTIYGIYVHKFLSFYGLWLILAVSSQHPWLAATPDGFVNNPNAIPQGGLV